MAWTGFALLALADQAAGACLTLRYFQTATCSGTAAIMSFEVPDAPGSLCLGVDARGGSCTDDCSFWLKDTYCSQEGYKQKLYRNKECAGDFEEQVMNSTCAQQYTAACHPGVCPQEPLGSFHGAYATLQTFDGPDCTGSGTNLTFPTWNHAGSPCEDFATYSVSDQYCDENGHFKQTVYTGLGCRGEGNVQVFDYETCVQDQMLMENTKLGVCMSPTNSLAATRQSATRGSVTLDEAGGPDNSMAVAGLLGTLLAFFYCCKQLTIGRGRELSGYEELSAHLPVDA